MDRDTFEAALKQTYDPLNQWNQQELLHALLMGHRPTIARYRAQVKRAERAVKERMVQYNANPADLDFTRKPELMDLTKEELDAELARIPNVV